MSDFEDFKNEIITSAHNVIDFLAKSFNIDDEKEKTVALDLYNDVVEYAASLEDDVRLLEDSIRLLLDGEVSKTLTTDKLPPLRQYTVEVDMTGNIIAIDLVRE